VNQDVIERLQRIHPATVSEYDDGNGPVAWVLVIPTTTGLMNRFLKCEISEKELFGLTQPDKAMKRFTFVQRWCWKNTDAKELPNNLR
jgi:hypothetical protein